MSENDFAAWLRFEREHRGWTLAKTAEVLGVHWNTVARWERGEMTPSSLAQRAVRDTLAREKGKRGRG